MGNLVPFDKRRRAPRAKATKEVEGQVVLFTGVRYSRGQAPLPADGSTPVKPKRKRG